MEHKMIRVSLQNWDKLRMLGHHPETFDDIISKVLKVADKGAETE
jgi:hypothetical protein